MKLKFLSFKVKTGSPSDNNCRDDQPVGKSVQEEDRALFESIGRYMNKGYSVRTGRSRKLSHGQAESELEQIRKEIQSENLEETAKYLLHGWESGNNNNDKRAAIREFVSSSFDSLKIDSADDRERHGQKHGKARLVVSYSSAAAAAIIGIFLIFRPFAEATGPDKIFIRFYEPFNLVNSITRAPGNTDEINIGEAIQSYKKGDYKEAVAGFSAALNTDPASYATIFYLGIAELASDDPEGAIRSLEKVMVNQGVFSSEATWYLGLAYLKSGDPERSRECFDRLSGNSGYYSREAEAVLRRLK